MYGRVMSMGLSGLNAFLVTAEIETSKETEDFQIIGLGDTAVRECKERIKSAFRTAHLTFLKDRTVVNLAPADVKKTGTVYDLAIAVAICTVQGWINYRSIEKSIFIGEVALSGEVRAVRGVLPMTILAQKLGFKEIFVPAANAAEAAVVSGITVYGVSSLQKLVGHFVSDKPKDRLTPEPTYIPDMEQIQDHGDFEDIKGQELAKRALEIAASGGHNALLIGPPGSGKSMLAKALPSILPRMTFDEAISTTNVYSVAGEIDPNHPLVTTRPFRSPHHTVSTAGLSGGGTIPRPGEISLAHNGVLFLDELAEFSRNSLEILRQPLEDGKVTISRASGSVTYPCSFMLIGAMNPCPCGYYGHPTRKCTCTPTKVAAYLSKISGPMLDRFDIHCEAAAVEFTDLSSKEKSEPSAAVRERVQAARDIQNERYKNSSITCNAKITPDLMSEVCPMTDEARQSLKTVFEAFGLSARAYDKILKVARTIADLDRSEVIEAKHIMEASSYRTLDRKYWNQ